MKKKIEYFMSVKHEGATDAQSWLERMDQGSRFDKPENDDDAKQTGEEVIEFFNSTLTPSETVRELIHVERHTTSIEVL